MVRVRWRGFTVGLRPKLKFATDHGGSQRRDGGNELGGAASSRAPGFGVRTRTGHDVPKQPLLTRYGIMVNVQQHGSTASAQQSSSQFSQSGRARFASSSARMRGKHAGASRHGGVQLTAASPSSFFCQHCARSLDIHQSRQLGAALQRSQRADNLLSVTGGCCCCAPSAGVRKSAHCSHASWLHALVSTC